MRREDAAPSKKFGLEPCEARVRALGGAVVHSSRGMEERVGTVSGWCNMPSLKDRYNTIQCGSDARYPV